MPMALPLCARLPVFNDADPLPVLKNVRRAFAALGEPCMSRNAHVRVLNSVKAFASEGTLEPLLNESVGTEVSRPSCGSDYELIAPHTPPLPSS